MWGNNRHFPGMVLWKNLNVYARRSSGRTTAMNHHSVLCSEMDGLLCSSSVKKDLREGGWTNSFYFLKWSLKIFICLLVWLCWVLVVTHGIFSWGMQTLSGSLWNLVPWPGIKPGPPALGVWSLSHWNHQGSPKSFLNFGQAVFKS